MVWQPITERQIPNLDEFGREDGQSTSVGGVDVPAVINAERAAEVGRERAHVFPPPCRVVRVHELITEEVNVPAAVYVEDLDEVSRIILPFRLWADGQRRLLLVENVRSLSNVRRC